MIIRDPVLEVFNRDCQHLCHYAEIIYFTTVLHGVALHTCALPALKAFIVRSSTCQQSCCSIRSKQLLSQRNRPLTCYVQSVLSYMTL